MSPVTFSLVLAAAADASAISADNPLFAYAVGAVIVGAIITTVTVLEKIDAIVQRRKRQPSVDVDLVGLQAAIKTLTSSVDELKAARADHVGHRERIVALEEKCRSLDAEANAAAASQRSHLAKLTRELYERIENVEKTVALNFKEVERGLGRVEGALSHISKG
jgi:hypothetical protein